MVRREILPSIQLESAQVQSATSSSFQQKRPATLNKSFHHHRRLHFEKLRLEKENYAACMFQSLSFRVHTQSGLVAHVVETSCCIFDAAFDTKRSAATENIFSLDERNSAAAVASVTKGERKEKRRAGSIQNTTRKRKAENLWVFSLPRFCCSAGVIVIFSSLRRYLSFSLCSSPNNSASGEKFSLPAFASFVTPKAKLQVSLCTHKFRFVFFDKARDWWKLNRASEPSRWARRYAEKKAEESLVRSFTDEKCLPSRCESLKNFLLKGVLFWDDVSVVKRLHNHKLGYKAGRGGGKKWSSGCFNSREIIRMKIPENFRVTSEFRAREKLSRES